MTIYGKYTAARSRLFHGILQAIGRAREGVPMARRAYQR